MENDIPITEIKSNLEKSHFEILKEAFNRIGLEYEEITYPKVQLITLRIPDTQCDDDLMDFDFDFSEEGVFVALGGSL